MKYLLERIDRNKRVIRFTTTTPEGVVVNVQFNTRQEAEAFADTRADDWYAIEDVNAKD